jgi:hypothetical protein
MRNKLVLTAIVFVLALTSAGVSTAAPDDAPADAPMAVAGANHMAVQGTDWVAERPGRFLRFRPYAWGVMTRAKEATQQWVHIAVPTPTYIDNTQLKVAKVEFCASATQPTKSAPVAIHVWKNHVVHHKSSIVWPNTKGHHCHFVTFDPPVWMESVGISVLVKYANSKHKVTLHKAWIAMAS